MPSLSIRNNQQVDEPSVLATVPMWFGLLDEDKAGAMIAELAQPEHEADWGMRIISSSAAKYSAGGYHFGSVWPLFTGWASVGEYRYHRASAGIFQSPRKLAAGARWIAGARHRGSFRRLLSASLHQFATADMVRRHGHQPAAARPFWSGRLTPAQPSGFRASCSRGLDRVHARQRARGCFLFAHRLSQDSQ